jgi:glycosyltransferase involved in cell wall biosynthesis
MTFGDIIVNIVVVTPFFNEKPNRKSSLILLVKELSKCVDITIISSKVEGTKSKEIINPNLRIIRFKPTLYLPKLPYTLDFLLVKRILKTCKRVKCDIIIGYSLQFLSCFSAAIAAKLGKYPFVCRIVGASRTTNKTGVELLSKIYDLSISKMTLRLVDKVFVQSKNMIYRPLNLGVALPKISIVEDGIDFGRFSQNPNVEHLREMLEIDKSKVVITFISRLFELKGIEDLLDISKEIINQHENVIFLIAGAGSLEEKVKSEAERVKNLIYLGYRDNVPDLLSLSDIYVLPSYSEGLSPALLEAMASGLPVVTTNVGSSPDIIINGKHGYLIKPGDKLNLKNYLIKLIQNESLRKEIGNFNKRYIQQNFDLKNTALKMLAEIKKIL